MLAVSPAIVKNMLPRQGKDQQQYYKPPIHVDEIGLTSDKYIPLNDTVRQLPLRISYAPMELQVALYHDKTRPAVSSFNFIEVVVILLSTLLLEMDADEQYGDRSGESVRHGIRRERY